MHSPAVIERRVFLRSEASFPVTVQQLPATASVGERPRSIHGQSRNISSGGICLLLDHACEVSSVLRCELFMLGSAIAIPTLAQVRRVEQEHDQFAVAIEFILR